MAGEEKDSYFASPSEVRCWFNAIIGTHWTAFKDRFKEADESFFKVIDASFLQPSKVMIFVESFLADKNRMSKFHGPFIPDMHKKAAFLFHWWLHFRPICSVNEFVDGVINDNNRRNYMANEFFAIYMVSTFIGYGNEPEWIDSITDDEFDALFYQATFRTMKPEDFAIQLHFIEQTALLRKKLAQKVKDSPQLVSQ